jgi:hypothetical protein
MLPFVNNPQTLEQGESFSLIVRLEFSSFPSGSIMNKEREYAKQRNILSSEKSDIIHQIGSETDMAN